MSDAKFGEPLVWIENEPPGVIRVMDCDGKQQITGTMHGEKFQRLPLRRMMACVNALAGLNPAKLGALLDELDGLHVDNEGQFLSENNPLGSEYDHEMTLLRVTRLYDDLTESEAPDGE